MIRLLALAALALALGGALAVLMLRDAGYVLIAYADATLETSLWFALGAWLLLWLAISALFFLIRRLLAGRLRLADWMAAKRRHGMNQRALQGTLFLGEGRSSEAAQSLLSAAARMDAPLLAYFAAAKAANDANDTASRERALESARESVPDAAFVIDLVRTELQQESGEWQASADLLTTLRQQAPRHPLVLERLFRAHRQLNDWDAIAELAPTLPEGVDDETQAAIWRSRLNKSKDSVDAAEHARATWQAMPKKLRSAEAMTLDYVDMLAAHGADDEAERVLRRALKADWRPAWLRRYAALTGNAAKRAKHATEWLAAHPDDPTALYALGAIAIETGDTETARAHLQRSADLEPAPATLVELARLNANAGDHAAASECYAAALRHAGVIQAEDSPTQRRHLASRHPATNAGGAGVAEAVR